MTRGGNLNSYLIGFKPIMEAHTMTRMIPRIPETYRLMSHRDKHALPFHSCSGVHHIHPRYQSHPASSPPARTTSYSFSITAKDTEERVLSDMLISGRSVQCNRAMGRLLDNIHSIQPGHNSLPDPFLSSPFTWHSLLNWHLPPGCTGNSPPWEKVECTLKMVQCQSTNLLPNYATPRPEFRPVPDPPWCVTVMKWPAAWMNSRVSTLLHPHSWP